MGCLACHPEKGDVGHKESSSETGVSSNGVQRRSVWCGDLDNFGKTIWQVAHYGGQVWAKHDAWRRMY